MKRVFNLIIIDESGSMSIIKRQARMGLNETIETIGKMQKLYPDMEQRVTLITLTKYIFDTVPASKTHKITSRDYCPNGATPLYDAIGVGIFKLYAQTNAEDNVLVTIITDGEENASQAFSLKMVKTLIEKLKKQNWTFTLIGTDNLDVEGMAGSMAIDNHLEFQEDAEGTRKMFISECRSRCAYNASISQDAPMPKGGYFKLKKNK